MSDPSKVVGAFEKVTKLKDNLGYITWEREISERLEVTRLMAWVKDTTPLPVQTATLSGEELEKAQIRYTEGHSVTCAIIRIKTEGTSYYAIKNLINAKTVWDTLRRRCQPKGSGYLTSSLRRFSALILSQCSDPNEYCNEF